MKPKRALQVAIEAAEFSKTSPQNVILWMKDAQALLERLTELEAEVKQMKRAISDLYQDYFN